MKISIVVPVYNEARTIEEIIRKAVDAVWKLGLEAELIVVDDASTDGTADIVERLGGQFRVPLRMVRQVQNQGKGAALKQGFQVAQGDIVLIQDADLEYDPSDYGTLLQPIINGKADVVFGSRFHGVNRRKLYFWHHAGNWLLTLFSNACTNLDISDMETGYKVFRREVIQDITPHLRSKRFGIEPELTARVAHGGPLLPDGTRGVWRVYEVPINYYGRTYEEGKKIGWRDGIKAIGAIIYFNFFDRR